MVPVPNKTTRVGERVKGSEIISSARNISCIVLSKYIGQNDQLLA